MGNYGKTSRLVEEGIQHIEENGLAPNNLRSTCSLLDPSVRRKSKISPSEVNRLAGVFLFKRFPTLMLESARRIGGLARGGWSGGREGQTAEGRLVGVRRPQEATEGQTGWHWASGQKGSRGSSQGV